MVPTTASIVGEPFEGAAGRRVRFVLAKRELLASLYSVILHNVTQLKAAEHLGQGERG
jgi:hypothetical protein